MFKYYFIVIIIYIVYIALYTLFLCLFNIHFKYFIFCLIYNKTKLAKIRRIFVVVWSFCVPLPEIPLFWFCVMFVTPIQTGEYQFISVELMKWGAGRVLCVLYGINNRCPKNFFEKF